MKLKDILIESYGNDGIRLIIVPHSQIIAVTPIDVAWLNTQRQQLIRNPQLDYASIMELIHSYLDRVEGLYSTLELDDALGEFQAEVKKHWNADSKFIVLTNTPSKLVILFSYADKPALINHNDDSGFNH